MKKLHFCEITFIFLLKIMEAIKYKCGCDDLNQMFPTWYPRRGR